MRISCGRACLCLCSLVFVVGLATAAREVSNRQRGGDLYALEMQRLRLEQEIPHLRDTIGRFEIRELSIESANGDPQTADG